MDAEQSPHEVTRYEVDDLGEWCGDCGLAIGHPIHHGGAQLPMALWDVFAQHEDDEDGWQDVLESRAVASTSEAAIEATRKMQGYGDSWRVWTGERYLFDVAIEERGNTRL